MRCKRPGCDYLRHDDPKNNGGLYCCRACKMRLAHGGNCQKIHYDTRSVVNVTNLVLKAWGKSTYGHYVKFKFKNNGSIPDIDEINYQLRIATVKDGTPRLIDSGTIPYLYDNTQIIYTNFSIIDKYIILGIQTKKGSLLGQYCFGRKLLLTSSPFLHCNYFSNTGGGGGGSTTTTTTSYFTTTTSYFTTTYAGDPFIYVGAGKKRICGLVNPPSSSLEFPTIPNTVISIDEFAFNTDNDLNYANLIGVVKFPPSLKYIGKYAFYGCNGLTGLDFTLSTGLLTINESAFDSTTSVIGTVIIPKSVTLIERYAFHSCGSITDNPILSIETVGSNLTTIDDFAFSSSNLKGSFVAPSKLTNIGTSAFLGANITSIDFGFIGSKITVGGSAFSGNTNLTGSLRLTSRIQSIGEGVFQLAGYDTVIYPIGLNIIPKNAFANCSNLKTFTFQQPSLVEIIDESAFSTCSSLTNIDIPYSVTDIKTSAFGNCTSLTNVTFSGWNLKNVMDGCFAGCSNLNSIVVLPPSVSDIWNNPFYDCMDLKLYYPTTAILHNAFSSAQHNTGLRYAYGLSIVKQANAIKVNTGGLVISSSTIDSHTGKYHLYYSSEPPVDLTDATKWKESGDSLTFTTTLASGYYWVKYEGGGTWYSNIEYVFIDPFSYQDSAKTIITGFTTVPTSPFAFPPIPQGVVSIKDNAFDTSIHSGYTNLTGVVVIPPSLTYIGIKAFNTCTGLTGLDFSSAASLVTISDRAFYSCQSIVGDIVIPDKVTRIGKLAFASDTNTNIIPFTLTLGNSVSIIDDNAFNGSLNLVGSLTIGPHVTYIGEGAFSGTGLNSIDFGTTGSSFSISDDAFSFIPSLSGTLRLSSRISALGVNVFKRAGYDSLIYPSNLTYMPAGLCSQWLNLTTYMLPAHITIMRGQDGVDGTFRGCLNLVTFDFEDPSHLQTIGIGAFAGCNSLTNIAIPASVTAINERAFYYCTDLVTFSLSEFNLTTIQKNAFKSCTSLYGVFVLPPSLTNLGEDAFSECPDNNAAIVFYPVTATLHAKAFFTDPHPPNFSYGVSIRQIGNAIGILTGGLTPISFTNGAHTAKYHLYYSSEPPRDVWPQTTGWVTSFDTTSTLYANLTTGYYWIKYSLGSGPPFGFWYSNVIVYDPFSYEDDAKTAIDGLLVSPDSPMDFPKIPIRVTSIKDGAFDVSVNPSYGNLQGVVVIPPFITSIGKRAFYACDTITGLDFTGATSLITIDNSAFEGTLNVTGAVNIPNRVTRIGKDAFTATGLSSSVAPSLILDQDLSELTVIDDKAFINSNFRGDLIFPKKLVRIGKSAFDTCTIDSIEFGYSGSNITVDDVAFARCTNLSGTLVLSKRIVSLGINVFESSNYDSIVFPPSITTIPTGFFYGNTNITAFGVPAFITNIANVMSSGNLAGNGVFEQCTKLGSLQFEPQSRLTNIGSYAFNECAVLAGNVCIPKTVQTIGTHAFDGCSEMTSLTLLTGGLTYISANAFSGCTSLACIVVVPPSATNIANGAFSANNDSLIVFYPYNVTLGTSVFQKAAVAGVSGDPGNISHFAYKVTLTATEGGFQINTGGLTTIPFVVGSRSQKKYYLYWSETPPTDLTDDSQYELSSDSETLSAPDYSDGYFWIKYSVSSSAGTGPPSDIWYSNILHIDRDPFSYEDAGKTIINGLVHLPTGPFDFPHIPPNATSIKNNAFNAIVAEGGNGAYANLTGNVMITPTITYIGVKAFYGCDGLTGVDLSWATGLITIDDSAFEGTVNATGDIVIPNTVTRVGKFAFGAYSSDTNVPFNLTLGTNLSIIDDNAFSGLVNLEGSITIGPNVTKIGKAAFGLDTKLTSVDFGTSGSRFTIDYQAFFDIQTCEGTLTLTSRIISLGTYVFASCGYNDIIYPSNLTFIPVGTFDNFFNLITYTLPKHIIFLNNGDRDLDQGCFSNCINLTSFVFESPSQLQVIGVNAFNTCYRLQKIDIPPSVIEIGAKAFQGKPPAGAGAWAGGSDLESATFCGTNLKRIGAGAFAWCNTLTGIIVLPPSLNYIGENAFFQCPSSLTVYYPATATLYRAFEGIPKPAHFSYQVFITLKSNRTGINVNLGGATTDEAIVAGLVSGKKYHIIKSNNPPIDLTTNSGYQDSFDIENIDLALTTGYYWMKYSVDGTNILYSNTLFVP